MIDENVCPTNDEPKETSHDLEKADALLLYQARLNVKEKKATIMNMVAYISTWLVLGLIFDGVFANRIHPEWRWRTRDFVRLHGFAPDSTDDNYWLFSNALSNIESYFLQRYTTPLWYVIIGVMLAWGCWLAVRVAKHIAKPLAMKMRAKFFKNVKPDPVMQEYNRLKNMADEATM
ncbi:MAG: hypothetical protein FWB80_11030 [Defluviitaleaceae bacterium]|nr:hypothetical protein [Defluviitaleaceae bacterium]